MHVWASGPSSRQRKISETWSTSAMRWAQGWSQAKGLAREGLKSTPRCNTQGHETRIATLKMESDLQQLCQERCAGKMFSLETANRLIEGHLHFSWHIQLFLLQDQKSRTMCTSCRITGGTFQKSPNLNTNCIGVPTEEKSAKVSRFYGDNKLVLEQYPII